MKLGNPLPEKKARIEIIPLIDIMFFLLASFMMASLTMIRMQSIKMDLPVATTSTKDFKPDIINIAVNKAGGIFMDKTQLDIVDLHRMLSNAYRKSTNVPIYISGDRDAMHGDVVRVLEAVRLEGIQKVAFNVTPQATSE